MNREAIEEELLLWIAEPWNAQSERDDARFERLALALFRFQYGHCEPYARLCRSLDRVPENVMRSEDVPAVPTGAFKEFDLRCFAPGATILTFQTSGTSTERRGRLHLDSLRLYQASLLSSLRTTFLTDLKGRRPPMRFLAPSPIEAPDSSLTAMFATLAAAEGGEGCGFDLRNGALDLESLAAGIARAHEADVPLVLAGTSFAFVHFLDATRADTAGAWKLPGGSRVMETGGFKGRSREVSREKLRADLATRLGLHEASVVNQYGMTELASQFYDSTLIDRLGPRRKLTPPWARVRLVDPDTGDAVEPGEVGLVVVHDLANTGSVAAIQTADLGRAVPAGSPTDGVKGCPGFDLIGRAEGIEQRGCSIAADVMLEAAAEHGATG
ncbi:MAG: acyl-protein synthetase [Deltaproteobacteria bacterium]|nr:acyl-protein synthetase [Deltaproteobacteria bacterium]